MAKTGRAEAALKRDQMRNMVVETIIKQMESGSTDWLRPWTKSGGSELPVSNVGRSYRGINVWWLWANASQNGWGNEWGTFASWKKAGEAHANSIGSDEYFGVQKGMKSTPVFFYKMLKIKDKDNEDEEKMIPLLKWFYVFNRAQTNLPDKVYADDETHEVSEEAAELEALALYDKHNVDLRYGGGRAFYRVSTDHIQMPNREHFRDSTGFTATLLHELTHWTGHPSRLNRKLENSFGGNEYAFEELIAEMGAAMVCAEVGVDNDHLMIDNHAAYVTSWLKGLKTDGGAQALWRAAAHAQKAADWILGTGYDGKEDEKNES